MIKIYFYKAIFVVLLVQSNLVFPQHDTVITKVDTTLASEYSQKAANFVKNAQYDSSIYYLEKASLIYKKAAESEDDLQICERYVTCLTKKVENLSKLSKFQDASKLSHELFSFCTNKFPQNHPIIATIYNFLGEIYNKLGKYDDSLKFLNQALVINHLHENRKNIAANYALIGVNLNKKASYADALKYFNQALAIYLELCGEKYIEVGLIYLDIGNVYSKKGDYDSSLEYYYKALKIIQDRNEYHSKIVSCYNNIGIAHYQKKEYDKALEYQCRMLNLIIKTSGEEHPELAACYNNLGLIYECKQDYDKAIASYHKCLAVGIPVWGEDHPAIAGVYGNIGALLRKKGDYDEALMYHETCLSKLICALGKNHPDVALEYENVVHLFMEQYQYDKALHFVQKGIMSILTDFNNPDIYTNPKGDDLILELNLLSLLNLKANLLSKRYISTLNNIEDLQVSFETYNLAVELIDKIRKSYKAEGSKLFLGEQAAKIYEQAIQTALKLHELSQQEEFKEGAFLYAEKSKAGVLIESVQDSRARQFGGIPSRLIEKEQHLRIDLTNCENEIQKEKLKKEQQNVQRIHEFEDRYFALNREYEKLIVNLEHNYPKYFELKYKTETSSISELQHSLDNQTVLLEYFIGDSLIHIFTITQENFNVTRQVIDSTFAYLIESFRTSAKADRKQRYIETAYKLYNILITPIADKISQKMKLVIIPHGNLLKIPFESFLTEEPKQNLWESLWNTEFDYSDLPYFLKKHDISYHYSATLYLNGIKKSRKIPAQYSEGNNRFIGFAPVFGEKKVGSQLAEKDLFDNYLTSLKEYFSVFTRDGKSFCELRFSQDELQGITNEFKKRNKMSMEYLYDKASEENFKTRAGKSKYIHLATHSFINEDEPRFSGIAFYQPHDSTNKEIEDGILYAGEIYNLDLNANLVVLSSCESGIGKLIRGEGIMALTRGFLYSGARNIMFSLWKVNDRYTSQLMVDFYKEMLSGKNYAKALRAAKLRMINNEKSAKPVLWSGFVLIGT